MVHFSEQELLVNLIKFSWERNDVSPPNNCYCPVILSSPCSFSVQQKPSHLQLWWLQLWYWWFCCWTWYNFGPPYGRKYFHQSSGRLCDGRLIIDFLCKFYIAHLHLFTIFIFNYEIQEVYFFFMWNLDWITCLERIG